MPAAPPRTVDTLDWLSTRDRLPVTVWSDPATDAAGFEARGDYVETYWLAVLGPSCVLAARRLAGWLEDQPAGFDVPLGAFARTLGLGTGTGRHAPIIRTLARLVGFDIASIDGDNYTVRLAFPPLGSRHVKRLPGYLAVQHADELHRLTAEHDAVAVPLRR